MFNIFKKRIKSFFKKKRFKYLRRYKIAGLRCGDITETSWWMSADDKINKELIVLEQKVRNSLKKDGLLKDNYKFLDLTKEHGVDLIKHSDVIEVLKGMIKDADWGVDKVRTGDRTFLDWPDIVTEEKCIELAKTLLYTGTVLEKTYIAMCWGYKEELAYLSRLIKTNKKAAGRYRSQLCRHWGFVE